METESRVGLVGNKCRNISKASKPKLPGDLDTTNDNTQNKMQQFGSTEFCQKLKHNLTLLPLKFHIKIIVL